jgi:hypothetical protein
VAFYSYSRFSERLLLAGRDHDFNKNNIRICPSAANGNRI